MGNNLWKFSQLFNTNIVSFHLSVQERRKPTLYYDCEGGFVELLVQSLLCVDFSLTSFGVHKCMILT